MAGIAFVGRTVKLISNFTRSTATNTTRHFTTLPLSTTPWLRLPTDMNDPKFVYYDNFLNIVDKKLVKIDMVYSYGIESNTVCVGSTRGSLAYLSQSSKLYLTYPYTGGGDEYDLYTYRSLHSSTRCFTQVGDILTVLCDPVDFFISWPETDVQWIRYHHLFHKEDPPIVYSSRAKTAYKLSRDVKQRLWVEQWDMSDNHIKIRSRCNVAPSSTHDGLLALLPSDMKISKKELRMRCQHERHLVVTGECGDKSDNDPILYLVVRYHNREVGASQTRAVDVFRFDLVEGRMIYTTKLDDHAFFIGVGSDSFAIPVEKCSGLKADSVYIADDLRVYDLKEGSMTPIVDMGDLEMTRLQAFWVPPPTQEQVEADKSMYNSRKRTT